MPAMPAMPAMLLAVAAWSTLTSGIPASAQPPAVKAGSGKTTTKGVNPLEVKRLDAKLDEVRESFLRETTTLILSYDRLGQFDRAKTLLESLQKLDPRNEAVKTKLADLNQKIVDVNEFEIEIDPEKSWQAIGTVTKDRPLRIRVAGEYKLSIVSLMIGPEGAPTASLVDDLVAHVPLGAVMGVIMPAGSIGTGGGNQNEKPPQPFTVGISYEKPADRNGVLYLKVNVPPGAKCTGEISVKVSGPDRPSP